LNIASPNASAIACGTPASLVDRFDRNVFLEESTLVGIGADNRRHRGERTAAIRVGFVAFDGPAVDDRPQAAHLEKSAQTRIDRRVFREQLGGGQGTHRIEIVADRASGGLRLGERPQRPERARTHHDRAVDQPGRQRRR
jgi:hypothetical protein